MKRKVFFGALCMVCALSMMFVSCKKESAINDENPAKLLTVGTIVWNGEIDRAVAADIGYVESQRPDASGPKIASNAHSSDFPGIYFIWDYKQKDNGYLKVSAQVFANFRSFTLTSKETCKFFDFKISIQPGQVMTEDYCYVFFIPKVYNNRNINMVFVSEFEESNKIKIEIDDDGNPIPIP